MILLALSSHAPTDAFVGGLVEALKLSLYVFGAVVGATLFRRLVGF